jgi:hypothetical protein
VLMLDGSRSVRLKMRQSLLNLLRVQPRDTEDLR